MKKLDWVDILLHGVVALAVCVVLTIMIKVPIFVFVLNSAAWFARELWQQRSKGKPLSPLKWSAQKHWEWLVPTACGGVSWTVV